MTVQTPSSPWSGWPVKNWGAETSRTSDSRLESHKQKRSNAEKWVIAHLNTDLPELCAGVALPSHTQQQLDCLFDKIEEEFAGRERAWRHNLVVAGLLKGRKLFNWPYLIPNPIVRLRLRGSPINQRNFAGIPRFRTLRKAFVCALTEKKLAVRLSGEDEDRKHNAGLILLSAILFGGALNRSTLSALSGRNNDGLQCYGDLAWVEWNASQDKEDGEYWQRWIADPLTGLLLVRVDKYLLEKNPRELHAITLWHLIEPHLAMLELSKQNVPTSITKLLDWGRAWAYRYSLPFVAEYAAGKLPSANLPPHAWRRILSKTASPYSPAISARENDLPEPGMVLKSSEKTLGRDESTKRLRQILDGKPAHIPGCAEPQTTEKREVSKRLFHVIDTSELNPIMALLYQWCRNLVDYDRHGGAAIKPVSVLRKACSIDRALYDIVGDRELQNLPIDEIEDIYEQVLNLASTARDRQTRSKALCSFHGFVAQKFGINIDLASLADGGNLESTVNANLLTEVEFQKVLALLLQFDDSATHARAVAFVLGYRCQLRRSEVYQLKIADIQGETRPELLIRPRRNEKCKSSNAVRRIPLWALLGEQEKQIVTSWHAQQMQNLNKIMVWDDDTLIRLINGTPLLGRINEASIFDRITETIRLVTLDASMHFHHCRHSGVNRNLLLLLESGMPGVSQILDVNPTEDQIKSLQVSLIGHARNSAQFAWGISGMAGHAAPDVTFGSYFHLCDWLVHYALRAHQPDLSWEALASIADITAVNTRKRVSRYGIKQENGAWFQLIRTPDCPKSGPTVPAKTAVSAAPVVDVPLPLSLQLNSAPEKISPNLLIQLLSQIKKAPDQLGRLCVKESIDPERCRELLQQAELLASISGRKKTKRVDTSKTDAATVAVESGELYIARPVLMPCSVSDKSGESVLARMLYRKLMAIGDDDSLALDRLLTGYWGNCLGEVAAIRTDDKTFARKFVDLLKSCFTEKQIGIVHIPSAAGSPPDIQIQRQYWEQELDVTDAQVIASAEPMKKHKDVGYGLVIIGMLKPNCLAPVLKSRSVAGLTYALNVAMYCALLVRLTKNE